MQEDENTETSSKNVSAPSLGPAVYPDVLETEVVPVPDVVKFTVGSIVYHRLDADGSPGLIMGLLAQPGHYKYLVRWESLDDAMHFDFELSNKPCIRERRIDFIEDDD
jgi:hypothetical protein